MTCLRALRLDFFGLTGTTPPPVPHTGALSATLRTIVVADQLTLANHVTFEAATLHLPTDRGQERETKNLVRGRSADVGSESVRIDHAEPASGK